MILFIQGLRMELIGFPCLHEKEGHCTQCDLSLWNIFGFDLPSEIWQCHVFKWLNRLEQLSVMLTCKRLYNVCTRRRVHTDRFGTCPVCNGRIRAATKKVKNGVKQNVQKNSGSGGVVATCGCWMHARCRYANDSVFVMITVFKALPPVKMSSDDYLAWLLARVKMPTLMDPPKSFELHYNCERCKKD